MHSFGHRRAYRVTWQMYSGLHLTTQRVADGGSPRDLFCALAYAMKSFVCDPLPTHPQNLVVIQGQERSPGLKTILNFFNPVGVWDMQRELTTAGLTSMIVIWLRKLAVHAMHSVSCIYSPDLGEGNNRAEAWSDTLAVSFIRHPQSPCDYQTLRSFSKGGSGKEDQT
ncbi:hypothetical protein BDV11DRAFT_46276 [Aspergillus similis]